MDLEFVFILTVSALLLLFILLLWRLLKRILRLFPKDKKIFGESPGAIIINLGIVTFIFPGTISKIVYEIIRFFIDLILLIPKIMTGIQQGPSNGEVNTIKTILDIFIQTAYSASNIFYNLLRNFPITGFLLTLALWVLIAQFLSLPPAATPTTPGSQQKTLSRSRFAQIYQNISKSKRQNILFTGVFLISIYLSIVAIVSVPLIEPKEEPIDLKTELSNDLEQLMKTNISDEDQKDNPFEQLETYLNDWEEKKAEISGLFTDDKEKTRILSDLESCMALARDKINKYKNMRNESLKKWNEFQKEAQDSKTSLLKNAENNFLVQNKIPMSNQERILYYRTLSNWSRNNISGIKNHLAECKKTLRKRDELWRYWAVNTKSSIEDTVLSIENYATALPNLQNRDVYTVENIKPCYISDILYEVSQGDIFDFFSDRWLFQLPSNIETVSPSPEAGLGSGIFGSASRWLLETRSLELALIVGMLGFGLFGALISSFVRQFSIPPNGETPKPDQPLVKDLTAVVIRGFSAAMVLFLAVEGGFAIFSTSTPKPNPYALFFTCLIGAVFSERVWEWAKDRLSSISTPKNGDKEQTTIGSPKNGD